MNDFPADGVCFRCKGCGQPAFYFPSGVGGKLPPGAVGHTKLVAGKPVPCTMYNQLGPREFWFVNSDAERLESPAQITPPRPSGAH